jgi:CheY-like chemotaxis protein
MVASEYVLVVDDDPDARALMNTLVAMAGMETREASGGHQALQRIRERIPAVVILDLMMPGMHGFTVLRHLQHNPRTRGISIIIVTAARVERHNVPDQRGTVIGIFRKGDMNFDEILETVTEAVNVRSESVVAK